MNTVALPLEIFLHIFLYLTIEDILALRQTCKDFQAMTQSRSVWALLYQTYVLEQDIPTPKMGNERSIESMGAHDLEGMTIRSVRLRNKWTSAFPLAARKTTIMSHHAGNSAPRVIGLHFLPGHGARWLISVHAFHIGGQVVFTVRNWDLLANPPVQTICLTSPVFGGLAINTQAGHPFILAVQRPHLEIYSMDAWGTLKREKTFPDHHRRLFAFAGNTVVFTANNNGSLSIMNVDDPDTETSLFNPANPQPDECHSVFIHTDFLMVLRGKTFEIYDLFIFRNADPDLVEPQRTLEAVACHKWQWRLDSGCLVPQMSHFAAQQKSLPPIYILARFGSWFPWPVNILHHIQLTPNPAYGDSLVVSQTNLPYLMPPAIMQTIASPIRLFSITHMVLGKYGSAVWIDTHTEDYYAPDCGQRLAGYCLKHVPDDIGGSEIQQTTVASTMFDLNEQDTWVRLAIDEAEGRLAAGHSNGKITIYDYA
ncbi:F-box domain-containing protein [Pleurotus pulmonarius]